MSSLNPNFISASAPYDNSGFQAGYQQPDNGPWGNSISGLLAKQAKDQVPFDQLQFMDAMNNGCQPPPCKPYPTFPPPAETGWIYPSLQKEEQRILMGDNLGCFPMAAPFVNDQPTLPSVALPLDSFQGKDYSPQTLLNMYACANTPQPVTNQCFGYMPYDATYMSATMGAGARADGWQDNLGSPLAISSPNQPLAVQTVEQRPVLSDQYPDPYHNLTPLAKETIPQWPPTIPHVQNYPQYHVAETMTGGVGGGVGGGNGGPLVTVRTNSDPLLTTITQQPPTCNVPNLASNPSPLYNTFGQVIADPTTMPMSMPAKPSAPPTPNKYVPKPSFPILTFPPDSNLGPNHNTSSSPSSDQSEDEVGFFVILNEMRSQDSCEPFRVHKLLTCMGRSVRGIVHDLSHWNEIHPHSSLHHKLQWIFTRNDRMWYILSLILMFIVFYYLLSAVPMDAKVKHLLWIGAIVFLIYLFTPRLRGMLEVQKITALLIIGLVLWNFWTRKE